MKYPLVPTRNNILQANCQKSTGVHTMVFFFLFLSVNESSGWPLIIWSLCKSISDFPRLFLVWERARLSNQHAEIFRKQDNGGSKAQKPDWKEIFSGWSCMTGLQRLMSFGHLQHICTFYMSLHKIHLWLLGSPGNK